MKKSILLLILIFHQAVAANIIHADEIKVLNGYTWEHAPYEIKDIMVSSFLKGYCSGGMHAAKQVADDTISYLKFVNSFPKSEKTISNFIQIIERTENKYEMMKPTISSILKMKESPEYYRRELDSFLGTYPLCKKQDIFIMLGILAGKWSEYNKQTYREISEICSE
jgi:hypothetical protein